MLRRGLSLILAVVVLLLVVETQRADPPAYAKRWVYAGHNMLVPEQVDALIALIQRAARAGYNAIVLTDFKFNILGRMPPHYFKHVERVKAAAKENGLEIIPALFPIGYSDGLLMHDANLTEGLPVVDAPFVMHGREAVLAADKVQVRNGGLEEVRGDKFAAFGYQDEPGKISFADRDVHHGGAVSCRFEMRKDATARLIQTVSVRPHACYRLSCWVKTQDLQPAGAHLLALGKSGKQLTFHETHLKPTQDWTLMDVAFNSLGESEVNIYAGQWGGNKGRFWIDDIALEELALVNVLRRDGCPLAVKSADAKTAYREGDDYLAVRDDKLGRDPHEFSIGFRHPGAKLLLGPKSRIQDGARLRVSWYHPVVTHGEQVMCCLSDPRVYELLEDQARRVNELFHPSTFFMSHDEIRVANWCRSCQGTGKTPGEQLAGNVSRCVRILRDVNPKAQIVVWSDMFDPYHNAVDDYYLVRGSLKGSWEGLPKDVIVMNWNGDKAAQSMKWFADRGHTQMMAGYYDQGPETFTHWRNVSQGVPRVAGFMYTTWESRFGDLEAYSQAMMGEDKSGKRK